MQQAVHLLKVKETTTFRDGSKNVQEREFLNKASFLKTIRKSPISSKIVYELAKHNEAFITYDDGVKTRLELIEDDDSFKLIEGENGASGLSDAEGTGVKA